MRITKPLLAISLAIIFLLSIITTMQSSNIQKKVLAQTANSNDDAVNRVSFFSTYTNLTSGLKISYPSYWVKSEEKNIVSFISPLKTIGVKLAVIPSANTSLDEFTTKRILILRELKLINFKITQSHAEQANEMLIFNFGNQNNTSKMLQAWTIKDNKAYLVTYFADAALFDTFLPTASKIIDSIQINTTTKSIYTVTQLYKSSYFIYTNSKSGMMVSYPSYWNEYGGNNSVSFISPLRTIGINFQIVPDVNMSLDEFTAKRILTLRSNLTNFYINASSATEFMSSPSQYIIFFHRYNGSISKVLQGWTIKGGKAYIFAYYSEPVFYDTFLPSAVQSINSFQIKGSMNESTFVK
jgi:hypothetical protein